MLIPTRFPPKARGHDEIGLTMFHGLLNYPGERRTGLQCFAQALNKNFGQREACVLSDKLETKCSDAPYPKLGKRSYDEALAFCISVFIERKE